MTKYPVVENDLYIKTNNDYSKKMARRQIKSASNVGNRMKKNMNFQQKNIAEYDLMNYDEPMDMQKSGQIEMNFNIKSDLSKK